MTTTSKVALAQTIFSTPSSEITPDFMDKWLTDDVELAYPGAEPIPFARTWRGREAFTAFMADFFERVEAEELSFSSMHGDGDTVFIQGLTTGRVRATGKRYTSPWLLVWTFRGDQVCRMVEYHDTQAIAAAFT